MVLAGVASQWRMVPGHVLGQGSRPGPANRVTLGCVGVGQQGLRNLEAFLALPDCQVIAVCDVDQAHATIARQLVNRIYGNTDCAVFGDFRELLSRRDLDAVCLALPHHWHAIPAVLAAQSGKDIYAEPPLAHTIPEGRLIRDTVRRYGRIWQTGSRQRSAKGFRRAVELVRNGRIGRVHTVEVGMPAGHPDLAGTAGQETAADPPNGLDYDRWLGPAAWEPYCPARVHGNWRWQLDYGGGQLLEWVGHHVDMALWGIACEETGPLELEGQGEYPGSGLWNAATRYRLTASFRGEISMIIAGGYPHLSPGVRWIGDQGWIRVDRDELDASPRSLLEEVIGPDEFRLGDVVGHHREFLDCVRSRRPTVAPVEAAHRAAAPGHLGQIAMRLNRKIRWNPLTEAFLEDATASRLLETTYRAPWRL